jgi:hypothetical protein
MAKRRSTRRAAPRRSYAAPRRKKGRRTNTLNRSVKKPMQALGVGVGLASVYGPAIWQSVKTMNVGPASQAIMNKQNGIQAAKNVAVGYIAGTAAGVVADKSGLKRIVNKGLRFTRGLI